MHAHRPLRINKNRKKEAFSIYTWSKHVVVTFPNAFQTLYPIVLAYIFQFISCICMLLIKY